MTILYNSLILRHIDGRHFYNLRLIARLERKSLKRNALSALCFVDSQRIKLAPMITEQRGIGGNKRVNGRKRHILTDVRGRIYKVHIHAANKHDSPQGTHLLKEMVADLEKILVDKSFAGAVEQLGSSN